ncbi:MAG: pyruvate dehydrogenase complex dihydrolipoamide acetyltransferase [Alphaproteobacteria bacterium]|nr:pyruvate dehydrogenase complex dihydrolipoamide acetyltransferase [Alphaproteobacteria bacterium]
MSTKILMPALSPTMEEGKLAKWLVKEGDVVHSGDVIAEIETDKATMEFEAVDEGRIAKILVPEGREGVKVNEPIAVLAGEGEDLNAAVDTISSAMASIKDAVAAEAGTSIGRDKESDTQNVSADATQSARTAPTDSRTQQLKPTMRTEADRIFASPLARRIAADRGIDLSGLKGSGPRGRIVKADVETVLKSGGVTTQARGSLPSAGPAKAAATGAVAPLPDAKVFFKSEDYDLVPHDSMRKSIARRLTSATSLIPHFYLTIDCRIDSLLQVRAKLNGQAPKGEGTYKLSVNDFVVKATALALKRVPEVNASWTEDAVLRHHHANIGVAVALDFGLITPIVFRAEDKGLIEISSVVKELADRARAKQLKPQEFEGGTFAISNLGMFGIKQFTAVINPPHAAILAVGAGEERAVIRDGKVEAATVMTLTMSCDHRVIDGATGARFLSVLKIFLEDPAAMLL